MKLATVVGARPQFVKAAVVAKAIAETRPDVTEMIVHTGQHYDVRMSELFFQELEIPSPSFHLGIGGGSHGENTGRTLEALDALFRRERPDAVLVYGDTDSTLAGALAASKLHIRLLHVEAGLRSFNRLMPEETNRVLTDHCSDKLFAPTETAVQNLRNEGIEGDHVALVGDVMFDAVRRFEPIALRKGLSGEVASLIDGPFALVTLHRAENTDDESRLREIVLGFEGARLQLIWPMHPRTKKRLAEFGISLPTSVTVTPPLGYFDMLLLESRAALVVTDSGGVQKEAYFHKVPCITLRTETEWTETVASGANQLIYPQAQKVAEALASRLHFPTSAPPVFGDGDASLRIAALL